MTHIILRPPYISNRNSDKWLKEFERRYSAYRDEHFQKIYYTTHELVKSDGKLVQPRNDCLPFDLTNGRSLINVTCTNWGMHRFEEFDTMEYGGVLINTDIWCLGRFWVERGFIDDALFAYSDEDFTDIRQISVRHQSSIKITSVDNKSKIVVGSSNWRSIIGSTL